MQEYIDSSSLEHRQPERETRSKARLRWALRSAATVDEFHVRRSAFPAPSSASTLLASRRSQPSKSFRGSFARSQSDHAPGQVEYLVHPAICRLRGTRVMG